MEIDIRKSLKETKINRIRFSNDSCIRVVEDGNVYIVESNENLSMVHIEGERGARNLIMALERAIEEGFFNRG